MMRRALAAAVPRLLATERERINTALGGVGAHGELCRFPDTECTCGVIEFREEARRAIARTTTEGGDTDGE
jgi:hypothetical protein